MNGRSHRPVLRVSVPRRATGPDGCERWEVAVEGPKHLPPVLWFAVDADRSGMLSPTSDAALLGLLIPAMRSGADLALAGTVSADLLDRAQDTLQRTLRGVLPSMQTVRIEAAPQLEATPASSAVGLGFSAGVDSLFSVLHHRDPLSSSDPTGPDAPPPDHLQFFNVGSHGVNGRAVFEARRVRLVRAAEALGLPLVWVDSNLDEFFDVSFQRTHVLRNAAAAHVLSAGMGTALMSSTGLPGWDGRGKLADLAQADGLLLPACSSQQLRLVSSGSACPRVEKTRLVSRHPVSFAMLDVCTKSRVQAGNCSACRKCLRTMLTLDVLGRLGDYRDVFDLRRYRRLRPLYASYLWVAHLPLSDEVLMFARAERFAPVLAARRWRWLARPAVVLSRALSSLVAHLPAGGLRLVRRAWNRM